MLVGDVGRDDTQAEAASIVIWFSILEENGSPRRRMANSGSSSRFRRESSKWTE